MTFRKICSIGLLASIAMAPAYLAAQEYPTKSIEAVVPFPPGGVSDMLFRILAPKLSAEFKVPVVVTNKPGAGGIVGTTSFAKGSPDGHAIIEGYVGTISINPGLHGSKLQYDPERDLIGVASLVKGPLFLVVHPSIPAKTLPQLVAFAKANPGKLTYASAGNGGSNHLAMELLKTMAQIDILHVPYNGNSTALNAVLGGHVSMMLDSGPVLAHGKMGRVTVLAATTAKRVMEHPDIPTIAESFPGYEFSSWHGAFVPAGTPPKIVERLNKAINKALVEPDIQRQLSASVLQPFLTTPEEFARFMREETRKWTALILKSGATIN